MRRFALRTAKGINSTRGVQNLTTPVQTLVSAPSTSRVLSVLSQATSVGFSQQLVTSPVHPLRNSPRNRVNMATEAAAVAEAPVSLEDNPLLLVSYYKTI